MKRIVVMIPCYNEALTIAKVVHDFKINLPNSTVYVYDNNSTDGTDELAKNAGAIVRYERKQGKGNVVRTMFSEIYADVYLLVDGDDTYPAEYAAQMVDIILNNQADMVIGDRLSNGSYLNENKRKYHGFGNTLVRLLINKLFQGNISDIMTGYRAFNRKFIKNFPLMSGGFELETEMTIFALDKRLTIAEVPIDYRDRPEGSFSKLNTIADGKRVLTTIIRIFKDYKPFVFFSLATIFFGILGLVAGIPVIYEYIISNRITHIPLAILSTALEILSALSLVSGFILDTVVRINKQNFELRLMDYHTHDQ